MTIFHNPYGTDPKPQTYNVPINPVSLGIKSGAALLPMPVGSNSEDQVIMVREKDFAMVRRTMGWAYSYAVDMNPDITNMHAVVK